MMLAEIAVRILALLLEEYGPDLIREHIDRWEAARAPSDAAFVAKFGKPPREG